jgi:citrate/tricarballylate utilization protein
MRKTEVIESARRDLEICAACRFCDDYCVVFHATDRRRGFSKEDIGYLANLCHNCRNCYYACQYAPPHEFALNLPQRLAQIRAETYREYAWPRAPGFWMARQGLVSAVAVVLAVVLTLAATLGLQAPEERFSPHLGPGAFYAIVPWKFMAGAAGASLGLSLVLLALGVVRFWRDMGAWTPREKGPRAWRRALVDVLTLRQLGGGGHGCNDVDEAFSTARRRFHHLLFYGLALCFASTLAASFYDHFLGLPAPYPLWSLPVVLGVVGGAGMIFGAGGLTFLKRASDPKPAARETLGGDYALLGVLAAAAASGLLLLAFRETGAVSALLAIHLGVVLAFFVLMPWGKFVHGFYRAAALLRAAMERGKE